jgi:AIG1 family
VLLLVLSAGASFGSEDAAAVAALRAALGPALRRRCLVLFTHGDELQAEGTSLEAFLEGCPPALQVCLSVCVCAKDLRKAT